MSPRLECAPAPNEDGFTPLSEPTPPDLFPSPFDPLGPHPIAQAAATRLQEELLAGAVDLGGEGKMFGVLVVRRGAGELGFVRAFSGTLRGVWRIPGFAPPVFDPSAREEVELPGEREVSALTRRGRDFAASGRLQEITSRWERLLAAQEDAQSECRLRHRASREARHTRRQAIALDPSVSSELRAETLHGLEQESRGDKAELRRLLATHAEQRREVERELRHARRRLGAHERLRAWASRRLMRRIHDAYRIRSARGEERTLRSLFAPGEPPSGAADCAGPKLIAWALARGWTPLALAEFWWGPPPLSGGRLQGSFYPACSEKCGPVLPFMLEGLEVAPPRRFLPPDRTRVSLRILFEDETLVVVDKPAGLLSVPGKDALGDSVLERLRVRHPQASGPLLVHRLDLDTSGLLVACLQPRAHRALQKQFLQRTVEKRYVAVLDGEVAGDEGQVALALRVDLQDRPRQIHDPVHGKAASTGWRVLAREPSRTRVALIPHTGRTHQLRVHAAHPLGLGVPIVGDRLYGREGPRLLLHAEQLAFGHPLTGARLVLTSPSPF